MGTLKFQNRRHYAKWVLRYVVDPFAEWERRCRNLPKLVPVLKARGQSDSNYVLVTLGAGVAGAIERIVGIKAPAPRVWIAASFAEKRAVTALVKGARVEVIPYPLKKDVLSKLRKFRETTLWKRNRTRFFSDKGLDPSIPTFFFAGRISPNKGLAQFIDLAETSRMNVQLVLAGLLERSPGEDNALRNFRRQLSESDYCRTLILPGLSHQTCLRTMSYCDAAVALSTDASEDFGFLPREALALGLPVIMTTWGGYRDLRLPVTLGRGMVRQFGVSLKDNDQMVIEFGDFSLRGFVSNLRLVTGAQRARCARYIVDANQNAIELGLKKLKRAYANSRGKVPPRVEYTTLSKEILLRAAERLQLNSGHDFPRKELARVMGAKLKSRRKSCRF